MRLEDLTGQKFNSLYVIKRAETKKKQTRWLCRCDCGNETIVTAGHLKNGHTQSCGCLQKQTVKDMLSTHGLTKTKLYRVWRGIIDRTTLKSCKVYKYYGARGIKMCKEWEDFPTFYEWAVQNGYREGLTIDRIDIDGNYEPSNCRWATWKTQQNNRRNNRLITYNNETHTMKEWAEIRGINYSTLSMRINSRKWSIERSLGFV